MCVFIPLNDRKLVAAFIFGVSCVTLDPTKLDLVYIKEVKAFCPEVGIECGLFVRLYPATLFPACRPAL